MKHMPIDVPHAIRTDSSIVPINLEINYYRFFSGTLEVFGKWGRGYGLPMVGKIDISQDHSSLSEIFSA